MVTNELVAFQRLGPMKETLDPRSFTIATFALCGFANFSSIGIQIGGIGALAPNKRTDLARLGHSRHAVRHHGQSHVRFDCRSHVAMTPARSATAARNGEFARAERAAKFILSKTKLRPKIALGTRLRPRRFCRRACRRNENSVRENSRIPALDGGRSRGPARDRQSGQYRRRRDAGPRPSLRRLLGEGSCLPDARTRPAWNSRRDPDERRRRHQSRIQARARSW